MSPRLVLVLFLLPGCLFGGGDGDDAPPGGSLGVSGEVVNFTTGTVVDGTASVSTTGLTPAPQITTQGAEFTIEGIPESSAFDILAAVPPTHRATYSASVIVETESIEGLQVSAVSEGFLAMLSTAFAITPTAGRGILFARLVDPAGTPRTGIDAAAVIEIQTGGAVDGPYYLDAALMPASAATATSSSGWAIYFEVDPGITTLTAAAGANYTVDMPTSPINAGAVTIVNAKVTDGAAVLPMNVSFSQQVVPIFSQRGCDNCHSGNGPGRDLGGLTLDGGANLIYRELVEEDPTRVVVATPETSLVLTMPSREDPADPHPNITFTGATDPDYLLIKVWIAEGALDN
jgi:hypothetical protein